MIEKNISVTVSYLVTHFKNGPTYAGSRLLSKRTPRSRFIEP